MSSSHIQETNAVGQRDIVVEAAGLCCSLGYYLDASVCGLRANIDHFHESAFFSLASDPIKVASLPDAIYGTQRLERWIEYSVRDCASRMPETGSLFDPMRTAIVIVSSHESRPHSSSDEIAQLVNSVMTELRREYSDSSRTENCDGEYKLTVISQGRAGMAAALQQTAKYLVNKLTEQVLMIGIDSYLNAADINFYLQEESLFVSGNSNGFLPGEAAAALLLRVGPSSAPGLHISGIGVGHEVGRIDGSIPSRGTGLTHAIRAACSQANISVADIDFRFSDQNGEQFYSREAANAITRVMYGAHQPNHITLADKTGEIGAATGPAMLAWLERDMRHSEFSPGRIGLIHLSSDDGARSAIVVQYIEET